MTVYVRRAAGFYAACDRGMMFSSWEVRALQAGRKTEARRTIGGRRRVLHPADRVWVKEGWVRDAAVRQVLGYLVDGARVSGRMQAELLGQTMPRWASRFTLSVTDAWQERLGDISRDGAVAEGLLGMTAGELRRRGALSGSVLHEVGGEMVPLVWPDEMVLWLGAAVPANGRSQLRAVPRLYADPRDAFLDLWERLHPSYDPGDQVWVLRFNVETRNIDHPDAAPSDALP